MLRMKYTQGSVAIKGSAASMFWTGESMAAPRAWLAMQRAKIPLEMMVDLNCTLLMRIRAQLVGLLMVFDV